MRRYAQRAHDDGGVRLFDLADLEQYCYYVAGTVGIMLTSLFSRVAPVVRGPVRPLSADAVSFGIGLQLVNIVKDIAADLERGDCFMPTDLMQRHGVEPESLLDPSARPRALAVVHEVCRQARFHLSRATGYTLAWPVPEGLPIRFFCTVPLGLALATLGHVECGTETLLRGRAPKVGRDLTLRIFTEAQAAVGDADRLRALLESLGNGTFA